MTKALQFKHLTTPHETELEALREQAKKILSAYQGFISVANKEKYDLEQQLRIDRQLVDEFATLAGLAKFENEDLRRQLSEAQGIINTYSVELGKLNQEHAAMHQHCETINAQLKAALAENERLRKMGRE